MVIEDGAVTIDGREYITPGEYAARYDRDASGLREAARNNRCSLGTERTTILGVIVYPVDRINEWRNEATARKWNRKRPITDVTKIARRYDLDRMMVVRALNAKRLVGRQDRTGTWHIGDDDAAAWARDWLGIFAPVDDEALQSSP
jgi:hypothetical protein